MGTVNVRYRKDGSAIFTAQVRIRKSGRLVHSEAKSFDRKREAQAWVREREVELSQPGAVESITANDPCLADVITRYIRDNQKPIRRTKAQVLRTICSQPIARMKASHITSAHIIEWLQSMKAAPSTRQNYASHLSAVFSISEHAWGYPLNYDAILSAIRVARRMGLIGTSKRRERIPTVSEVDMLMEYFGRTRANRKDANDMQAIIAFALFSTRRLSEICRMRIQDIDQANSSVMVYNMKNPGDTDGNNVRCILPPEAMAIALSQPKDRRSVFGCNEDAVSAAFTRACKRLGLQGIVFHSLRHAGISRLFEMGWQIPRVADVSGHRSWTSLQRYTHLKEIGDQYAGWKWMDDLYG